MYYNVFNTHFITELVRIFSNDSGKVKFQIHFESINIVRSVFDTFCFYKNYYFLPIECNHSLNLLR